jgi:hypothetical protein
MEAVGINLVLHLKRERSNAKIRKRAVSQMRKLSNKSKNLSLT